MKFIVRAFVLALAVTGAAASTQITSAQTNVAVAKTSAMPIPMCAPDDANACGMR